MVLTSPALAVKGSRLRYDRFFLPTIAFNTTVYPIGTALGAGPKFPCNMRLAQIMATGNNATGVTANLRVDVFKNGTSAPANTAITCNLQQATTGQDWDINPTSVPASVVVVTAGNENFTPDDICICRVVMSAASGTATNINIALVWETAE